MYSKQVESLYLCFIFSTMDVHVVRLTVFFILDLFSHGKSVPVFGNYYDYAPNEGNQVSDDITVPYERYSRDVLKEYNWFPRSSILSRPRETSKRHYHLFHLTSKHPNAVSYHVIEKPREVKMISRRHKVLNNPGRNYLDNTNIGSQYQSYPGQSYYQQPNYQYLGYPGVSEWPQSQYGVQISGRVHDSTYDDILQEVSKPMQIGDKIIPPFHGEPRQNDQPTSSIEEAAKEFKTASADMNNMELASLVIYPIPRFNEHTGLHKKISKKVHHKEHNGKRVKTKESSKGENENKSSSDVKEKLVVENEKKGEERHEGDKKTQMMVRKESDRGVKEKKAENHLKNKSEDDFESERKENKKKKQEKESDKSESAVDKEEEDEMNGKEVASKDSWAEDEVSGKDENTTIRRSEIPHAFDELSNSDGEDEYTSSKRSEIPRFFDEISDSDEAATSKDKSKTVEATTPHINDKSSDERVDSKGNDSKDDDEETESKPVTDTDADSKLSNQVYILSR